MVHAGMPTGTAAFRILNEGKDSCRKSSVPCGEDHSDEAKVLGAVAHLHHAVSQLDGREGVPCTELMSAC